MLKLSPRKQKLVGQRTLREIKAFLKVTAYLNENELLTIGDLINKMREYLENTEYFNFTVTQI